MSAHRQRRRCRSPAFPMPLGPRLHSPQLPNFSLSALPEIPTASWSIPDSFRLSHIWLLRLLYSFYLLPLLMTPHDHFIRKTDPVFFFFSFSLPVLQACLLLALIPAPIPHLVPCPADYPSDIAISPHFAFFARSAPCAILLLMAPPQTPPSPARDCRCVMCVGRIGHARHISIPLDSLSKYNHIHRIQILPTKVSLLAYP